MSKYRIAPIWVALVALGCAAPAQAKLYKWVDADGNVTYSERKPPEAEAEEIKVRGAGVPDEEAQRRLGELADEQDTRERERDSAQSHATAVREREERIRKNCDIARENLRILETNRRVRQSGDEGALYLTPAQIEARKETTNANVQKYCQ